MTLESYALDQIRPGHVVGLGTGRAAERFLRALGDRVASGLAVRGIPTSRATADLALTLGIPLVSLDDTPRIDLAVDGADEVDPDGRLIKGYGGALLREKVVAAVVQLLEYTLLRVGNEEYARHNRSYGLTTLRDRHADVAARRGDVMRHLLAGPNLALIVPRQHKEEPGALVTDAIVAHKAVSAYDINTVFPLYLYPEAGLLDRPSRAANIAPDFLPRLASRTGEEPCPEAVLQYVYAVLYSPGYRRRYAELLACGTAEELASLYTSDATVEDPVGSGVLRGQDAIRQLYHRIEKQDRTVELLSVHINGDEAAFLARLTVRAGGTEMRIDGIDVMTFDDDGRITSMRAFWSGEDMAIG